MPSKRVHGIVERSVGVQLGFRVQQPGGEVGIAGDETGALPLEHGGLQGPDPGVERGGDDGVGLVAEVAAEDEQVAARLGGRGLGGREVGDGERGGGGARGEADVVPAAETDPDTVGGVVVEAEGAREALAVRAIDDPQRRAQGSRDGNEVGLELAAEEVVDQRGRVANRTGEQQSGVVLEHLLVDRGVARLDGVGKVVVEGAGEGEAITARRARGIADHRVAMARLQDVAPLPAPCARSRLEGPELQALAGREGADAEQRRGVGEDGVVGEEVGVRVLGQPDDRSPIGRGGGHIWIRAIVLAGVDERGDRRRGGGPVDPSRSCRSGRTRARTGGRGADSRTGRELGST